MTTIKQIFFRHILSLLLFSLEHLHFLNIFFFFSHFRFATICYSRGLHTSLHSILARYSPHRCLSSDVVHNDNNKTENSTADIAKNHPLRSLHLFFSDFSFFQNNPQPSVPTRLNPMAQCAFKILVLNVSAIRTIYRS